MRRIHVAAASVNQVPLDWDGNLARIAAAIAEARQRGVQLLCLPELCITGYGCEDAFHGPEICETAGRVAMREVAPLTRGMVVSVGLPVLHRCGVYNAALLFVDGRAVGLSAKGDLAGDGVHYEPRWFKAWPRASTGRVVLDGTVLPIGDLVYELDGIRLGFEICEEAWVAHRVGALLAHRAVDVVLNPSASHFAFDKDNVRERFVLEGSRAFGVTYLMANLVGNEAGRLVYDGGNRIASAGVMVARGPRLHFAAVSVTDAVVDVDLGRSIRARTASFRSNPTKDDTATVRPPFVWPDVKRSVSPPLAAFVPEEKCLEFTRAIALSLYDYTRKSWCRGWVVSLSGGADSAAVASLCAHAIGLASEELGIQTVWQTFAYALGPVPAEPTVEDMVHRMLTTLYQGTVHSSDTTRSAAADVARGLACRHVEWEVDPMVEACTQRVAAALGRELSWQTDDIAMQNIQARVRSPGVWMLANAEGKLLLATSNRSEAAVGYATMDGDTSGGLSPIAGIDKAFLRAWLDWMETTGTPALGPIPALRTVNVQQPTAELRPLEMKQTDEDDLMPYPVLDEIERLAIRDKYTPVSVFWQMRAHYPDTPVGVVGGWVARFFALWCRNQWKRERYAPGFHVDDKNLDPRTWCRFPILSSGFKRELAELEHLIDSLAAQVDP